MENNFSALLEIFFSHRMQNQLHASQHTIASYSDTFHLLLTYAANKLKKVPSKVSLEDINAIFVSEFLDYLEEGRGVSAKTRNTRLAAIRSFYNYLSYRLPECGGLIQQVLAIPNKRYVKKLVDFLSADEVTALLAVQDQNTWIGRRDHTLLVVVLHTGMRVSELISLKWEDLNLDRAPSIKFLGKGRKERILPLSSQAVRFLRGWYKETKPAESDYVFTTAKGKKMTSFPVRHLLKKYTVLASERCPSLKNKKVSPHMLRHTTAMRSLEAGVDLASIGIWLGHESVKTTYVYLTASMELKNKILKKIPSFKTKGKWNAPNDKIMEFLKALSSKGEGYNEK